MTWPTGPAAIAAMQRKALANIIADSWAAPVAEAAYLQEDWAKYDELRKKYPHLDERLAWWQQQQQLPPDARTAARSYTGDGYQSINKAAREKRVTDDVRALDRAMRPLPEGVTVHRGMRIAMEMPEPAEGREYDVPGFLSTSFNPNLAETWPSGVDHLELQVPKGTPAYYNGGWDVDPRPEAEVLLGRGQRVHVDRVESGAFKRRRVVAHLVPPRGAPIQEALFDDALHPRGRTGEWVAKPLSVDRKRVNRAHLGKQNVEERLMGFYERNKTAKEEGSWYTTQHELVAKTAKALDVAPEKLTAMVAATSPQVAWERGGRMPNLEAAAKAVVLARENPDEEPEHLARRLEHPGMLRNSLTSAVRIYRGEDPDAVLHGPKVRSFYNNLEFPDRDTGVTIDTQMARAILGSMDRDDYKHAGQRVLGKNGYTWAADRVTAVAHQAGVRPHEMQAAVWAQVRRELVG